jgi:hypothetical protein
MGLAGIRPPRGVSTDWRSGQDLPLIEKIRVRACDLRGISRLAIEATAGLTDLVEAMHHNIARAPGILGAPPAGPTRGITGLVYRSIRGVTRLVGSGIDVVLGQIDPLLGQQSTLPGREAGQAALNGVLGDYLANSGNPLAIPMGLRRDGQPVRLDALSPPPTGKLVVLVHGLCMNDLQWNRQGHNHGTALARDLGYTPVFLRYNSGRHISTNGRELADLLETVVKQWPVPLAELAIVGHSMGGLVSRSACHYGRLSGHDWPRHLRKLVFLGTPHHGAPLERGGHWVDILLGLSPYTAPLARLGKIRSAGITDLRHGNLLDEDWAGHDRFARAGDRRRPVPLPEGVRCYALAATLAKEERGNLADRLLGDGLVSVNSALGRHPDPNRTLGFPPARQWVGYGMNHLAVLGRPEAYEQIKQWLAA